MRIDCIIVEDEPLASERIREYVSRVSYLNLVGTFDNGIDAAGLVNTRKVDLIFLDINLGELSGIQFLETLQPNCHVIFTTAYHEYAVKGFDLKVTDYLLKPYTFERFLQAVNRVHGTVNREIAEMNSKFLFIKTAYRFEKVMLDDIFYIEGMRDYRKVISTTKPIMTLQTFSDFEKQLPARIICRVHKSYMVAVKQISSVEKDRIRIKDVMIPISETYRKAFFELIS